MRREFRITEADADRRLDRWLQGALGDAPFSLVRRLLRQKDVKVNGGRGRPETRLHAGDVVVVHHQFRDSPAFEPPRSMGPYEGPPIGVLHRDDDFVYVDKPPRVSCSDDPDDTATLPRWLTENFAAEITRGEVRPEPCHRLDRGTSGIVVVSLRARAHERFRRALQAGSVEKTYEVAVEGRPSSDVWTCELPLRRLDRARRDGPRVVAAEVGESGAQAARTKFRVLRASASHVLLEACPLTGRTHQIRAHCQAQGLPVVGDLRYGPPSADESGDGQLLHARRLRVADVENAPEVVSDWPASRRESLGRLGLV